jgi:aspartate/methionine/tyrosine aminotransferase
MCHWWVHSNAMCTNNDLLIHLKLSGLTKYTRARIVPVPSAPEEAYTPTPAACQLALEQAGCPIRALLLTNPQNPVGIISPRARLQALLAWAASHGIHVIMDEVYALSVFGAISDSADAFVSALAMRDLPDPQRVHFVWGPSKDLCMNGIRCGVFVSRNTQVLSAMLALNLFT